MSIRGGLFIPPLYLYYLSKDEKSKRLFSVFYHGHVLYVIMQEQ